jgi:hypothetical protein
MKKIFFKHILFVVSVLSVSQLFAQSSNNNFQLGLITSVNINWTKATSDKVQANGPGLGYSYGIMGDFGIKGSSKYFFSVEAIASNFRSKVSLDPEKVWNNAGTPYKNVNFTYSLNYIELPMSLKFKLNEIGYTTWFAQFGFAPGVLFRSSAKWDGEFALQGGTTSVDYYRNNDGDSGFEEYRDDAWFARVGMVIGAGMEYRFTGNTALVAGLRFNNGLTNFIADNKGDTKAKAINNFIGINVGLLF